MSKEVKVSELPQCNFCDARAEYDFAAKMGPWANGCASHWVQYRRHPELGTGRGQRLVLRDDVHTHDWLTIQIETVGTPGPRWHATTCRACAVHATPVLLCRVGYAPVMEMLTQSKDGTFLDAMQNVVGGLVQCITLDDGCELWSWEEACLFETPLNRTIPTAPRRPPPGFEDAFIIRMDSDLVEYGQPGEWRIHGDFFLARSDDEGRTIPPTAADVAKYTALFPAEPAAMFQMQAWRDSRPGQAAARSSR